MGLHFLAYPINMHFLTCGKTDTCSQLNSELLQTGWDNNLNPSLPGGGINLVVLLLLATPFLLGMFIGVPLIAREYSAGTNKLVWTQSVSRRKWLTVKLLWILFATALFAGLFAALTTWWSKTGNVLFDNRFGTSKFDLQGLVPVGYAIFAVSVSVAFGAWFKRTLAAIGATLVLVLATQIIVGAFVRTHYMTPWTYNSAVLNQDPGSGAGGPFSPSTPSKSGAAWIVGGDLEGPSGQALSWANPPQSCIVTHPEDGTASGPHAVVAVKSGSNMKDAIVSRNGGPDIDMNCLGTLGYHWRTEYQPAYRYWDFQRMELGLYLVMSLIPIGATYLLITKRDA